MSNRRSETENSAGAIRKNHFQPLKTRETKIIVLFFLRRAFCRKKASKVSCLHEFPRLREIFWLTGKETRAGCLSLSLGEKHTDKQKRQSWFYQRMKRFPSPQVRRGERQERYLCKNSLSPLVLIFISLPFPGITTPWQERNLLLFSGVRKGNHHRED